MYGAIYGDITGSVYEWHPCKNLEKVEMERYDTFYTDDTVCSLAVAEVLMNESVRTRIAGDVLPNLGPEFASAFRRYVAENLDAGYGLDFFDWALDDTKQAYGSWGNGAAMRVPAIGWLSSSVTEAASLARMSAEITHSHPDGIRGAQVVAVATRMLLEGRSKQEVCDLVEKIYGYSAARTPDEIRPGYQFELACAQTVPEALSCLLHTNSFDAAVRAAISLGGDADTLACITGGLAEACYGPLPAAQRSFVRSKLPDRFDWTLGRFDGRIQGGLDKALWPETSTDGLEPYVPPAKPDFVMPLGQRAAYEREMAKINQVMSGLVVRKKPGLLGWAKEFLSRR